jgi:hypothetical protein
MIIGTRHMDRGDLWYAQAQLDGQGNTIPNSAIENILRKDDIQDGPVDLPPAARTRPGLWLETCGSHAAANSVLATRRNPEALLSALRLPGGGSVRPPDLLTVWMNTPQNRAKLSAARPNLDPDAFMGNEIPQYFPVAVAEVFGAVCVYKDSSSWEITASLLRQRAAVQLCLIEPGHFITAKAYDDVTGEIIYIDPDPPRQPGDWKQVRMGKAEYQRNVKPWILVYPEEA